MTQGQVLRWEGIAPINRGTGDASEISARGQSDDFWHECARLRPMLTAMAARYGIPAEAEDVVHEAFLRARGYADLDIARLRPFLLTVVKRLCVDERRRRAAAQRLAKHPGQLLPPALDPAETVADRHEARWLLAQCGRLSDREHFVLQRLASGIDHAQIAAELGTTRRATECLASRARCRARAALADRRRSRW